MSRGRFKNTYELANLGAHTLLLGNKLHIFQCVGKIFWVEFQREPLTFPANYLTHTLKETISIQYRKFRTQIYELVNVFETPPASMQIFLYQQWCKTIKSIISFSTQATMARFLSFHIYHTYINMLVSCKSLQSSQFAGPALQIWAAVKS